MHEDFSSCEARILILDFFYSLREAYYKGERILILLRSSRTLVLPLGRTVGLMRSMRILILERSERTLVLPSGRSVALMLFFFISMMILILERS